LSSTCIRPHGRFCSGRSDWEGSVSAARAKRVVTVPAATSRPGALPRPRRISVLGATGSVGSSTLDLVGRTPHLFKVVALTAQHSVEALAQCASRHRAEVAVIADASRYGALKECLSGSGIEVAAGASGLLEAAERPADCVMAGISGAAGLGPTMEAVRRAGTELLPVDSEHSAVFQVLATAEPDAIERIILTGSGGPFRTWGTDRLARATPEEALRHPNWSMGRKITIDSATLMNKGLELIEAYHLFPVAADQLDVVVHPQQIIHALVAYRDGSMLAQLACPDMRTPIAVSLAWPMRMAAPTKRLDLVDIGQLSFERPNEQRFQALGLARQAMQRGGMAPAVLNAANEVAVEAFLEQRLGFLQIAQLVAETLELAEAKGLLGEATDLDGVLAVDASARRLALNVLRRERLPPVH